MPISFVLALALASPLDGTLARHIYPMSKGLTCPPVVIDVTDSPDSQAWAEQAKALVESWYSN